MMYWLLIPGLAVAAFVIAELACRWWLRRWSGYYVWAPGTRLDLRLDPVIFPEGERPVRFIVNADGERGGDLRGDEEGLYRVLVVGGSAVECVALDQGTSWPGALETFLNAPDNLRVLDARRVHVGNIGRSNVATADLDLILERVLPRYSRLDAIIIMVGAGDVVQWLEAGAPPSIPEAPIPPAKLFTCNPERRFGWKLRQLALVEIVKRVRRAWLRPWTVLEESGGKWYAAARRMRAEATEIRTSTPDPAVMLDRYERYLRQILRRAQAHADRVIVVRQPWFEKEYTAEELSHFWHGGVGKAWKEKISVYYSLEVVNRLMGLLDARAATVVESCAVQQVRPAVPPSLRHYFDYTHFTPAGAALIAQAVAAAVVARPSSLERPLRPVRAASPV